MISKPESHGVAKTTELNMLASSLRLKNKCRFLTIDEYIRLVCDDELSVLSIASASELELNEAKMDIVTEFTELSGDESSSQMCDALKKIYRLRTSILGLSLGIRLLYSDRGQGVALLKDFGIRANPSDMVNYRKRVNAEFKLKQSRLGIAIKEYNSLIKVEGGGRFTAEDFYLEISVVSKFVGHSIPMECNLAIYAGHKKQFKLYLKSNEDAKHRTSTERRS